jgi:WD40 repeat protein
MSELAAATVSADSESLLAHAIGRSVVMRIVRATIVWVAAALMMALAPALEAAAQDKPKIEVVPQIGHSTAIYSVAFSPDGRQVLSGSHDGTTRAWNCVVASRACAVGAS